MSLVRLSVPTFQNRTKQNNIQGRIVIATSGTVCLGEGIIDDSCLVLFINLENRPPQCFVAKVFLE